MKNWPLLLLLTMALSPSCSKLENIMCPAAEITPPYLTVSSPTNGEVVAPDFLSSGSVNSSGNVYIKIDNGVFHPTALNFALWSTNINLNNYSVHTNFAFAMNSFGQTTLTQMIIVDCPRPELKVTESCGNLYTPSITSYLLKGTCSAVGGISRIFISINNSAFFYISSEKDWVKAIYISPSFQYTNKIKIYAIDSSGVST